jgi:glycosyltransferase involved in cell wall biosynthesis
MDLSIIMPFCGEYPQNIFTLMSIWNQLRDSGIDYEVIAVNNWCDEAAKQSDYAYTCPSCKAVRQIPRGEANSYRPPYKNPDPGGSRVQSYAAAQPWLKYVEYKDKLSHWNAKNAGVKASTGNVLFFIDAHCALIPGSLTSMYRHYAAHYEAINGTLHMPIAYFLERSGRALNYKLVANPEISSYLYSFTRHRKLTEEEVKAGKKTYQVPCMSTCGMMMHRSLYDLLGGWPTELGVYGGGENFINFTLAVLGKTINIFPTEPLHHFAEKRGYNWYFTDQKRNQIIATYMFGGEKRARMFSRHCKLDAKTAERTVAEVIERCADHRGHIEKSQVMEIEDWYDKWQRQD